MTQQAMFDRIKAEVTRICTAERIPRPALRISFTRGPVSGKTSQTRRLVVLHASPSDWKTNQWLIVHELAHLKAGVNYHASGRRDIHGEPFYRNMWRMMMEHTPPATVAIALAKETQYKSRNATKWAKAMRVPGAYAQARKVAERRATARNVFATLTLVDGRYVYERKRRVQR